MTMQRVVDQGEPTAHIEAPMQDFRQDREKVADDSREACHTLLSSQMTIYHHTYYIFVISLALGDFQPHSYISVLSFCRSVVMNLDI